MARPSSRFILIFCAIIALTISTALAKEPKVKEKDLAGLTYGVFRDGSAPGRELLEYLVEQMHWDNGGAANLDRMSVHLRFEQVGEAGTPGGNLARYRLFAEGAPENKVYDLGIWKVGGTPSYGEQDLYVNSQGLVMTRRPQADEEALSQLPGIELYVSPKTIAGEPMRYALLSRDGAVSALGTLVPHPIASQDGGCRLEARIAEPNSAAVLLIADGFAARTRLPVVLESLGEISNVDMTTDDSGHAVVAGFPFIKGQTHGVLKASAEGQNCLPTVQIPWDSSAATAPAAAPAGGAPAPAAGAGKKD